MSRRATRSQRGVALLLVLWVFMILGVLALDFSRYMRDDAMAALNFVEETRGYYVAVAAITQRLHEALADRDSTNLEADPEEQPRPAGFREDELIRIPPNGQWESGEFAGAQYEVRLTDLEGRIDLNTVPERILDRILVNLIAGGQAQGTDRREQKSIDAIKSAIADWVDEDHKQGPNGAEDDYYQAVGGYDARNSPFQSVDELLLVRGVTPELFYGTDDMPGLRDIFTVFSTQNQLNCRTVRAPVLQALLGLSADEAAERLSQRDATPDDGGSTSSGSQSGSADPTANTEAFCEQLRGEVALIDPAWGDETHIPDKPSSRVLIEARADTSSPRNRAVVAGIFNVAGDDVDGIRVEAWYDRAPWGGKLPTGTAGDHPEGDS